MELKVNLENPEVYLSVEESELADAEQHLLDMQKSQEISSDKLILVIKTSDDLFDSEFVVKNEEEQQVKIQKNKEIFMLYQFCKLAYNLIKSNLISPLVFTDKSSAVIFSSFNSDYGLPKLDISGLDTGDSLLINTHEIS